MISSGQAKSTGVSLQIWARSPDVYRLIVYKSTASSFQMVLSGFGLVSKGSGPQ